MSEELGTLVGVEERLKKFAVAGGQDAATINQAHTLKALRDRERRNVTAAHQVLQNLSRQLSELQGTVGQQATTLEDRDVAKGPNGGVVQDALQQLTSCGVEVDQILQSAQDRVAAAVGQIATIGNRLVTQHKQQEIDFRNLIEKHQHAQGEAAERAQLERRRNDQTCTNGTCSGGGGNECPAGQTRCNNVCVNTATDNNNCGACGNVCTSGTTCISGACTGGSGDCEGGATRCNGICTDLSSDNYNCGACGVVCAGGETCAGGSCQPCSPDGPYFCP